MSALRTFACIILLSFNGFANAQSGQRPDLIQFSGVIVSGDSLSPVPYSSIIIRNTRRGTISDFFGFFSFVAQEMDTIEFSSMGYKDATFIIPDSLTTTRYSLIQVLAKDTIRLPEAVIYPWPTREQFREAFLNLRIPDGNLERARKNLAWAQMHERISHTKMDGSENYRYKMQQYQSQLYYAGQYPPINLFNPIAWAKFIRAWKNGDLKTK